MLRPWEFSAAHNDAAHRGAMLPQKFRQPAQYNIGTVVDRMNHHGRRDGVVDDERHARPMRDARYGFQVADIAGRIADRFAKLGAGLVIDQLAMS